MADEAVEELQFDRVVSASASGPAAPASRPVVTCEACGRSIPSAYFHINGKTFCADCRAVVEAVAKTPRETRTLVVAGLFGLGAGVAGAAIYYAVMAIAHLEIGIVAILIGYMVGHAVRRGAGNRGGLRFQVLAAVLTYASVALAYTPLVVGQAMDENRTSSHQAQTGSDGTAVATPTAEATPAINNTADTPLAPSIADDVPKAPPSFGRWMLAVAMLLGFVAILPVLVIVGSLPGGILSALIIFFGMRQAWKMTARPVLEILGPFRVGAAVATPQP